MIMELLLPLILGSQLLLLITVALMVMGIELERQEEDGFDIPELLIDRRNDRFCLLISHFGLLLFSCGTCTRSRISLCTSWRFCDTQALPAS